MANRRNILWEKLKRLYKQIDQPLPVEYKHFKGDMIDLYVHHAQKLRNKLVDKELDRILKEFPNDAIYTNLKTRDPQRYEEIDLKMLQIYRTIKNRYKLNDAIKYQNKQFSINITGPIRMSYQFRDKKTRRLTGRVYTELLDVPGWDISSNKIKLRNDAIQNKIVAVRLGELESIHNDNPSQQVLWIYISNIELSYDQVHPDDKTYLWLHAQYNFSYKQINYPGNILDLPVYDNSFEAPILFSQCKSISNYKMQCAADCIYDNLAGKRGFAKLTRKEIQEALGEHPTVRSITAYLRELNVSFNIRDPFNNLITKYYNLDDHHVEPIYAMVNNDHINSINDPEQRKMIQYNDEVSKQIKINWQDKSLNIVNINGYVDDVYEALKSQVCKEGTSLPSIVIITELFSQRSMASNESPTPDRNLSKLIQLIYLTENLLVENITNNMRFLTYKTITVIYNREYDQIMQVLQVLHNENPLNYIKYGFANQSLGVLASEIMTNIIRIQPSQFNIQTRQLFKYPPVLKAVVHLPTAQDSVVTLDINKSYRFALLDRDEPYYIMSIFDDAKPINLTSVNDIQLGYYVIEKNEIKLGPFLLAKKQMTLRSQKVKQLLQLGEIVFADIKYHIMPTGKYSKSYYQELVDYILSLDVEKSIKKLMINQFIGLLGSWVSENDSSALTTSMEMAFCMFCNGKINAPTCLIQGKCTGDVLEELAMMADHPAIKKNLYLMTKKVLTDKDQSYRNSYYDVLVDAAFNLHKLTMLAMGPNSQIVKYNTDSVTIINANDISALANDVDGGFNYETSRLPTELAQQTVSETFVNLKQKPIETFASFRELLANGELNSFGILSPSGYGKSTLLREEVVPYLKANDIKYHIMSYSGTAVDNINIGLKTTEAVTIDSFLGMSENKPNHVKQLIAKFNADESPSYIIIDEAYSMNYTHLNLLYKIFRETKVKFILIGDTNQLMGVGCKIEYDDLNIFRAMHGYQNIKLTKCYRYDAELEQYSRNIADGIENTISLIPTNRITRRNICYTHKVRLAGNQKCMQHFKDPEAFLAIPFRGKIEGPSAQPVEMSKGCPIEAINKFDCFSKRRLFILDSWNDKRLFMTDTATNELRSIAVSMFHDNFRVAYFQTTHATQGQTIDEDLTVHEADRMTRRLLYTAITRVRKMSQLHFNKLPPAIVPKEKTDKYIQEMYEGLTPGNIYALVSDEPRDCKGQDVPTTIFYIGKSNDMLRRSIEHSDATNNPLNESYNKCIYPKIRELYDGKFRMIHFKKMHDVDDSSIEQKAIQQCIAAGCPLLNTQLVNEKVKKTIPTKPFKGVQIVPKEVTIGTIYRKGHTWIHEMSKTVNGERKKTKKVFNIKKYGSDEAAKAAAEAYRRALAT